MQPVNRFAAIASFLSGVEFNYNHSLIPFFLFADRTENTVALLVNSM